MPAVKAVKVDPEATIAINVNRLIFVSRSLLSFATGVVAGASLHGGKRIEVSVPNESQAIEPQDLLTSQVISK